MKYVHDFLCPIYSFDPMPDTVEYILEVVSPCIREKLCEFVNSDQRQLLFPVSDNYNSRSDC